MKKTFMLLLVCLACKTASVYAQNVEQNLDASKKAFILARFCTEVKYNFVHYPNLQFNWDSLCMANLPSLIETKSDDEFIDGLKRLCVQLSDGHTYIYPFNNPTNSKDWIRPLPVKTKRIGDQVFITDVQSSQFVKQGLCYGSELLEIDGENPIQYANKYIRPTLASSTPQWSDYASFREFELTKAKGSKVSTLRFRNPEGKIGMIESDRNVSWDIKASSSALEFKILTDSVGLLTVKSFADGSFNRGEFDKIYDEVQKTKALIIDIRDNGGGNSSHADYMVRHFADKPIRFGRWSSLMYIAAHGSWGYPQEWHMESPKTLKPIENKLIYTKPIAVLVNATTFSSAENFCVAFRGLNRGKIIGTPTGGSTGNPITINLGFGVGCAICTRNEWDVDGNKFIGVGIIPDIEVQENSSIFLQNKDNVIEAALGILH